MAGAGDLYAHIGWMEPLRGKVVVITGASSGLGREAAAQFAEQGCLLVLAARRKAELEETARLCERAGGRALVVETDISDEAQVNALVKAALFEYGHIDIWVNNAGVTLFSLLEDQPFAEHRRVIETNLFGAMHCARAIVPVFRRQKHGVLIQVGSVLSKVGQAYVPSYVISKFALRGLSEALRVELADEPDIHVCTLLPYAIDTPHFETGANELGQKTFTMPPTQSPEKVARALVKLAEKPRRERHVPRVVALGLGLRWLRPRTTERLLWHALNRYHLAGEQPRTEGNLKTPPREPGTIHGERTPRVSTPRFAAWAIGEFARLELDALRRRFALRRGLPLRRVRSRAEAHA